MNNRHSYTAKSSCCSVGYLCASRGITRKTLFYYDRIGLLKPTVRTGPQQFKEYDSAAAERLDRILRCRNAGLSVKEIRKLLDDPACDHKAVMNEAIKRLIREREEKDCEIDRLRELMKTGV